MIEFIEEPDRRGSYIGVIGPSFYDELLGPVTEDDWRRWDLEDEWANMVYGGENAERW